MKKRILVGILAGAMMLGLVACGAEGNEGVESSSNEKKRVKLRKSKRILIKTKRKKKRPLKKRMLRVLK